jgi:conjugative transfer signal peptidase TraF
LTEQGASAAAREPRAAPRVRRLFMFAVVVALVAIAKASLTGHLLINYTPSVPRGIYWMSPGEIPVRGDLVAIPIPDNIRELVVERRYLPPTIKLLLKPVAAVAGDNVCVRDQTLAINGKVVGHIAATDRLGRPMLVRQFCDTLMTGQLFLATQHDNSFDSRNFGPVALDSVRGTLTPVVTF